MKKMKKSTKSEDNSCKPSNEKLWCVSGMAVAIIVLIWLPSFSQVWSRVVITILAGLIFIRSMMVNCSK